MKDPRLPVILFSAWVVACSPHDVEPPRELPLEVEYDGCQQVLHPGPTCVLREDRSLTVWAGVASAEPVRTRFEIRLGGRSIDVPGEPVREGLRYAIQVPAGVDRLEVVAESASGRKSWNLALSDTVVKDGISSRDALGMTDPESKIPQQIYDLIEDQRFAEAHERLDDLEPAAPVPAQAAGFLALQRAQLAREEADYREARKQLRRAVEIGERVADKKIIVLATNEIALLELEMGRAHEAARLFATIPDLDALGGPCKDATWTNVGWASLAAFEAGEPYSADPIPLLEKALAQYDQCQNDEPKEDYGSDRFNARLNLALAHLQVGQLGKAREFLAQARPLANAGELLEILWWFDLEGRLALEEGHAADALKSFERLEEMALAAASVDGRLSAAHGRARAEKVLGDSAAALAILGDAEVLLDRESLRVPIHAGRETFVGSRQSVTSLLIELLLSTGRADDALDAARRARSRVLNQFAVGERLAGLSPERRREWGIALAEYRAEQAELDEKVSRKWQLTDDVEEQAKEAWRRTAEEIETKLDGIYSLLNGDAPPPTGAPAPPGAGELLLAYHPVPQGWVAFAAAEDGIQVQRFELPEALRTPPAVLSRELAAEAAKVLLEPFRLRIERAQRVRVLPYGPLRGIDFHALPFAGDVLLAGRPVVYGLDLPVRPPARLANLRALVVADPDGTLPGTHEETRIASRALRQKAWAVTELAGDGAGREAVRSAIVGAEFFHFAGHGDFGGFGGWESSMRLAQDGRLAVGDLLALERAPSWVVLSACETGRSAVEAPVEGLGIAHAFLLAGSRAVVASTRPVKDRETLPFFRELYRSWLPGADPARALQQAQLAWRSEAPKSDWASFRIVEP